MHVENRMPDQQYLAPLSNNAIDAAHTEDVSSTSYSVDLIGHTDRTLQGFNNMCPCNILFLTLRRLNLLTLYLNLI